MATITGEKVPLGKLFADEFFFTIPDYQRPYSWKKENCDQLFDDLDNADKEKEYFFGTIILQEVEKIGNGRKYDIIDGQQRITTIQILFSVIRDLVDNAEYKKNTQELIYQAPNRMKNIPERVRLETKEKALFKNYIQTENKTKDIASMVIENDSHLNIKVAVETFHEKLSTYSQTKLEKFAGFLSQNCIVVYVSTESFDDAYRLFVVTNDRGLQLRRIDILKAQNLDPATIKDVEERKEYSKKWEDMEGDLGSEEFEQLFFYIRTIETKEKASEDLLKEFTSLVFKTNKINRGKDFIEYVEEYKKIYLKLFIDQNIYKNDKTNFVKFSNLINIMIDNIKSSEWIPSLLFYFKKFNENEFPQFLSMFENKFVGDWVNGLSLGKRNSNTYSILREIEKSTTPSQLFKSDVFDFNAERFKSNIIASDFYTEPYSKYILAKLDYMIGENSTQRKIIASSIEHVLPQNPKANSDWNKTFTVEEKEKWTNHISNLVLLSKRKNSSASNLDFKDKKDKYLCERITDLPSSMKVLKYDEWNPIILKEREFEILKLFNLSSI